MPSEAEIEAGAEATYALGRYSLPWSHILESTRDAFRRNASAVLEAAEAARPQPEPVGGVERALQGALDYLRDIDHELLDRHYEEQSWYLQCRPLVEALAVVHALAAADIGFGASWDDIRDRVLAPTEGVIDFFTSGAPSFRLAMEEGDPGWTASPLSQEQDNAE